jgi:TRAP transporter TAXI family solute receptor
MMKKKILCCILVFALLFTLVACAPAAPAPAPPAPGTESAAPGDGAPAEVDFDRSNYIVTVLTGPTSGIFYPIGGAFFQVASGAGYRSSVTATGASAANINALLSGDGEIAISMVDSAVQAADGTHAFDDREPATELRSVMGLWPNVVQIVTTVGSGIETFEDLRGRRVGVGPPGSGVEVNARMMFEAHGMTYDDVTADFLSYGEAIDQMRNGLVDAAFVTSGLGNATIMELGIDHEIFFIPVDGEARAWLIENYPFYIEFVIPTETYGTAVPTETVGLVNILLTHEDVPDYVIYDLMELFFSEEGQRTIHATHAQANEHIRIEHALRGVLGISVPLHDGAIQFFQSRGMM